MTHHYCIGTPCLLCSPQRHDIPTVVAEACLGCNQPRLIWKSVGVVRLCLECWSVLEAQKYGALINWAHEADDGK